MSDTDWREVGERHAVAAERASSDSVDPVLHALLAIYYELRRGHEEGVDLRTPVAFTDALEEHTHALRDYAKAVDES